MEYILPGLFIIVLGLVLLLNIATLPANWVMVGLVVIWRFVGPNPEGMNFVYFITLIGLAIMGEVIEFLAQAWGTKKYGSTNSGMFGGIVGAIIGAIVCAPLFFGLGALFGALGGAWIGCYAVERLHGRSASEAWDAAKGALVGRFFGIVVKCGIGGMMLALTFSAIWPKAAPAMPVTNF